MSRRLIDNVITFGDWLPFIYFGSRNAAISPALSSGQEKHVVLGVLKASSDKAEKVRWRDSPCAIVSRRLRRLVMRTLVSTTASAVNDELLTILEPKHYLPAGGMNLSDDDHLRAACRSALFQRGFGRRTQPPLLRRRVPPLAILELTTQDTLAGKGSQVSVNRMMVRFVRSDQHGRTPHSHEMVVCLGGRSKLIWRKVEPGSCGGHLA